MYGVRTEPPPRSLLSTAFRQEGLVSASQCEKLGVGAARRSRLVRDEAWERVTHGVFEMTRYGDRTIATLIPALVQAVPALPRQHAVAVLDNLVHRGLLTGEELETVRHRLRGRR